MVQEIKIRRGQVFVFSFFHFFIAATIAAQPLPKPDFPDVSYGPDSLQTFDLWRAPVSKPTPVVIFFHSGGFDSGDKKTIDPYLVTNLLARKISVVSANYRLLNTTTVFHPAPQLDAARVLQYLRWQAVKYNIDPKKVGLSGSSAGANLAVWLAVRDDMADTLSSDPVKRQSTRVQGVLGYQPQTSNDPSWIFNRIGRVEEVYARYAAFYNVPAQNLKTPGSRLQSRIDSASAIKHVTIDDPPVFMSFKDVMTNTPLPATALWEQLIHHPMFGVLFKNAMDALRRECTVYWASGGVSNNPMPPLADIDFLDKKLNSPPTGVAENNEDSRPVDFALRQNYPNPFWSEATSPASGGGNAGTTIRYTLPQASAVKLAVYEVNGRRLRVLVNDRQAAGVYSIQWNGTNARGEALPSGIYFYEIKTEIFNKVRKLTLLK